MYAHRAFRFDNENEALAVASEYNFATLLTPSASFASHLPMVVDRKRRVLRGHLARANPQPTLTAKRFTGPHAYISPDWYGPQSPDVPTWNYQAVHVRGAGRVIDQTESVVSLLSELSVQEETRRHDLVSGEIWTLNKTPEEKLLAMVRAIVAFEIVIDSIEAISKLGQTKSEDVTARVIGALGSGNERQGALASEMQRAIGRRGAR